jgi:hypothetical protein
MQQATVQHLGHVLYVMGGHEFSVLLIGAEPDAGSLADLRQLIYCAQLTAWLVQRLWDGATPSARSLVIEGPLARNSLYLSVLQALLPAQRCHASSDAMESAARGAWLLSRWHAAGGPLFLSPVPACALRGLEPYHAQWLLKL